MPVLIESIGNLERRLTFSVPEDRLESHVDERLREIARTARINGFRAGKVPAKVIGQRFGEKVRAEVLDSLLRETLDSAIRAHSLRLAGAARIDHANEGGLILSLPSKWCLILARLMYPSLGWFGVPPK